MSSERFAAVGRFLLLIGLFTLPACSPKVQAEAEEPEVLQTEFGDATYYANSFQGGRTASGLKFDNRKAVAAHGSFPFGTVARVTNLSNGKSVNVVVVDRGPYGKTAAKAPLSICLVRLPRASTSFMMDRFPFASTSSSGVAYQ